MFMKLNLTDKKYFKLIIIEISIIVFITIMFLFVNSNFIPHCFWQENFNLICPGCGSTRCVISLINGDFLQSFTYNPFLFVLIVYVFLLNLLYIINTILDKKYLKIFYPKWWYIVIYFSLWVIYTIILNVFYFL